MPLTGAGLTPFPQQFLSSLQNPVVDPRSGGPTKDFYYLLLAFFNRTGKGTGAPVIATGLTAAATVALAQQNAPRAADWNELDTVASGGICAIPIVDVGSDFIVWNQGLHTLAVTPDPSQQIDALGNGVAYSLTSGKMQWFRCTAQNQL